MAMSWALDRHCDAFSLRLGVNQFLAKAPRRKRPQRLKSTGKSLGMPVSSLRLVSRIEEDRPLLDLIGDQNITLRPRILSKDRPRRLCAPGLHDHHRPRCRPRTDPPG